MKVLVIENAPGAPAGLFGTWLEQARGATLHTVTPETVPDAPGDEALIVSLGSPCGAYEDIPWIHRQRRLLGGAIAAGRPVVGICFGAQLIATAIGGRATPFARRFVGWHANAEVADPVWRGPWVRWHGDNLEVPDGTEVLARDQGTVQAFQLVCALGVQFHPEADAAIVRDWATRTPGWLAENMLDPATLDRDSAANVGPGTAARHALFTEMLRRVGIAPIGIPPT